MAVVDPLIVDILKDNRAPPQELHTLKKLRNYRSNKRGPHNKARRSKRISINEKLWFTRLSSSGFRSNEIVVSELSSWELHGTSYADSKPLVCAGNIEGDDVNISATAKTCDAGVSLVVCGGSASFVEDKTFASSRAAMHVSALEKARRYAQQLKEHVTREAQCFAMIAQHVKQCLVSSRNALVSEFMEGPSRTRCFEHMQELRRLRKDLYQEKFDVALGLSALHGQDISVYVKDKIVQTERVLASCEAEALAEIKRVGSELRKGIHPCVSAKVAFDQHLHRHVKRHLRNLPGMIVLPVDAQTDLLKVLDGILHEYLAQCHQFQADATKLQTLWSERRTRWTETINTWEAQGVEVINEMNRCRAALLQIDVGNGAELRRLGQHLREECAKELRATWCTCNLSCRLDCYSTSMQRASNSLRDLFWREHGALIQRNLFHCFNGAELDLVPAPIPDHIWMGFLDVWKNSDGPSLKVVPAFHGTRLANLQSIFTRGLLIPGMGNALRVANGAVHGRGIYAAKVNERGCRLSSSFARGMATGVLVCAVLDDAIELPSEYVLGYRTVTAESKSVRHVGDAFVIFDPRNILPLFTVAEGYI